MTTKSQSASTKAAGPEDAPDVDEKRKANAGYGQANPADPTLNYYDVYNQGAPARGDDNTTQHQGEPVFPDGPPTNEDLPVPEYSGGGSGIVEPTPVPEAPEAPTQQSTAKELKGEAPKTESHK